MKEEKLATYNKKGGPKYKATDELVEKVYELSKKGMHKKSVVRLLPFGSASYFRWEKIARECEDKDYDSLTDYEKRCVQISEAYKRGAQEFLDSKLQFFEEKGENNVAFQWDFFKTKFKEYQPVTNYNEEDVLKWLRTFSEETQEKILELMENDSGR